LDNGTGSLPTKKPANRPAFLHFIRHSALTQLAVALFVFLPGSAWAGIVASNLIAGAHN